MKTVLAYWKIIRPLNAGITFLVVLLTITALSGGTVSSIALLASFAAAVTAGAGNVINDILDIEADRVNRSERILVQGLISKRAAITYYLFLIVLSIISSAYVSTVAVSIVILVNILLYIYSKFLKGIPLIGNIVVAGLTGFAFLYAGIIAHKIEQCIIFAVFAFFVNLIREIVKDIEDTEGDIAQGVVTFVTRFGMQKTKILITRLAIALIAITFVPVFTRSLRIEFFVICMIFVNPLLLYIIKLIANSAEPKVLRTISNLLKLCMLFGLVAIYMGIRSL